MIPTFATNLTNRKLIYVLDMPSFQRDFASLKTLDHGTGPAITFTRASGATFFDANGVLQSAANNVPRFDHDPVNGSSRGLLIEEQRTNHAQRSAEFDNAFWGKNGSSIVANTTTAPDGTTTADSLVEDSSAGVSHLIARNVGGVSPSQVGTASFFVKANTRNTVRITSWDPAASNNNISATFNVSDGTVVGSPANSGNGSGATASISNVGNGWYRCAVSGISNTGGSDRGIALFLMATVGGSTIYTGDGTSGVFIWGAQLELGAFPTSYIPTTTAAATRSAESAVVTPIDSFYNQAEGTLFAEASSNDSTGSRFSTPVGIGTTNNERIFLHRNASTSQGRVGIITGGISQAAADIGNWTLGAVAKIATAFKTDDVATTINGASVTTDTSVTMPVANKMSIGNAVVAGGSFTLNGHIRKLAYFPKRLSNALLEQLTT